MLRKFLPLALLIAVVLFLSGCTQPPVCGNDIVEQGEECETDEQCVSSEFCQDCKCVPRPVETCIDEDGDGHCIEVVYPNGGEGFQAGETVAIKWQQLNIDMVSIGYKDCESCLAWIAYNFEVDGEAIEGTYDWQIPESLGGRDWVKISIIGYQTGVGSESDESDGIFKVYPSVFLDLNESVEIEEDYSLKYEYYGTQGDQVLANIGLYRPDGEFATWQMGGAGDSIELSSNSIYGLMKVYIDLIGVSKEEVAFTYETDYTPP